MPISVTSPVYCLVGDGVKFEGSRLADLQAGQVHFGDLQVNIERGQVIDAEGGIAGSSPDRRF